MKLLFEGRINHCGQWWDIVVEKDINDDLSLESKKKRIAAVISGLKTAGIISRVSASPADTPPRNNPEPVANATRGTQSAMFQWPLPHCELHREAMTPSTVQKKEGTVAFYCTKQGSDGYCKHRAVVDVRTGIPKFYEVN